MELVKEPKRPLSALYKYSESILNKSTEYKSSINQIYKTIKTETFKKTIKVPQFIVKASQRKNYFPLQHADKQQVQEDQLI